MGTTRFFRFNLVGVIGFATHVAAAALLFRATGLHYLAATLIAVEIGTLHTFYWHSRWTWRDRVLAGVPLGRMLVRYHVTSAAVYAVGHLVMMPLVVDVLGIHVPFANCLTLPVCGLVNFLMSDRLAFA